MKIENKILFNLCQSIKTRYFSRIVIEGYLGGVTVYATDGVVAYRQKIEGDNKKEFTLFFDKWTENKGVVDTDNLESQDLNNDFLIKMKKYFNQETFNELSVNYKDWKQAVKGVDAINKGERLHDLVISLHNGDLDLASWNYSGSVSWQIEGIYKGNGAVCINKKYLDLIKSNFKIGYCKIDKRIVLYIKGDIDIVVMPKEIDSKMFYEVLGYEYTPVKTETVKKIRKVMMPRVKKFDGWTWNEKKLSWTKVCNW